MMPPTDPYAAFGGAAADAPPPGPPPPPAPSADPYAAFGGAAAPSSSIKDTLTAVGDNLSAPITGPVSGAIKGLGSTAAGIIELANKYSPEIGAHPEKTHAAMEATANFLREHTQTHGFFEGLGEAGESAFELMGLPELDVLGVGAKAASGADKLSEAARVAKFLQGSSKTAKVVRVGLDTIKSAARAGVENAGQTYVKTGGDTEAAEDAGIIGGAVGGVVGGGTSAYRTARKAASDLAEEIRPQSRTISDVPVETLASQSRNASPAAADAAKIQETPEYRAKQQAAAAKITQTEAQNSVRKSLTELNAGRETPTVTDPARILPAPEDAKPYQFTMDLAGAEPTPTREGQMAFDPGKQHLGSRTVEGKGPGQFDLASYSPELFDAETQRAAEEGTLGASRPLAPQEGSHREPIWQYRTSVKPDQADAASKGIIEGLQGGRGTMTFSGPEQAVSGLNQLQNIIDSPRFPEMADAQQARVKNAAASLRQQLDDFNAYRIKNPHFNPVDIDAAAQHTGDFSQGADQLEQAVQPVYDQLDAASNGEWGRLRKIEQNMRRIVNNPTTPEALDAASARLSDTQGKMEKILADNKESINEPEWRAANRVYRDASTMRDIHGALEQSYNGVDPDVAEATKNDPSGGIPRIMTGSDAGFKRLQALRQSRPEDVQRVLGKGYVNLYRMTDLLKDPQEAVAAKSMMKQIGTVLRRHGRALGGLGLGGIVGGAVGHGVGGAVGAGFGAAGGTMAGVLAEAYTRRVIHRIATDPVLADRFIYAVKNKVSPRIAAPLIASMFTQSERQPKPKPEETKP